MPHAAVGLPSSTVIAIVEDFCPPPLPKVTIWEWVCQAQFCISGHNPLLFVLGNYFFPLRFESRCGLQETLCDVGLGALATPRCVVCIRGDGRGHQVQ